MEEVSQFSDPLCPISNDLSDTLAAVAAQAYEVRTGLNVTNYYWHTFRACPKKLVLGSAVVSPSFFRNSRSVQPFRSSEAWQAAHAGSERTRRDKHL